MAQRSTLGAAALAAAALALPAAAPAASPYRLVASPSPAGLRQAITLTLRAPAPRPGTHYEVLLRTRVTWPGCASGPPSYQRLARVRRGVFRLRVRPDTPPETNAVWCGDTATARVRRSSRSGAHSRTLATVTVRVRDPQPAEPGQAEMLVSVLPGSTLTARVTGRPDRTTPLSGGPLRGVGTSILPWPVSADRLRGTIVLSSLAPDPVLCPGSTPPGALEVLPGSRIELARRIDLDLAVNRSPVQIFGCALAGAPAGRTTIHLSGPPVPDPETGSIVGSTALNLTGKVTGIALPGGATGELDVKLIGAAGRSRSG